jgi:hypothetical protein
VELRGTAKVFKNDNSETQSLLLVADVCLGFRKEEKDLVVSRR